MSKTLIFFSLCVFAAVVESRPSSSADVACNGCGPQEIIHRAKRNAEGILNAISGLVGNILHENWVHIERVRRLREGSRNYYIGNGRDNHNEVHIYK